MTMINTNKSHKNMLSITQTAFSWKNYSNNRLCDEKEFQKMIPDNSQNNEISINDTTKVKL